MTEENSMEGTGGNEREGRKSKQVPEKKEGREGGRRKRFKDQCCELN